MPKVNPEWLLMFYEPYHGYLMYAGMPSKCEIDRLGRASQVKALKQYRAQAPVAEIKEFTQRYFEKKRSLK